jgi:hypothetical protein
MDSSVGIAARLNNWGVWVRFPSIVSRRALWPIEPPIRWVLGAVYLGVKQQEHEADHSTPSSAEVKTGGAICLLVSDVICPTKSHLCVT